MRTATLAQCQATYDNASDPRLEIDGDDRAECNDCGARFYADETDDHCECPTCGAMQEAMIRSYVDDLIRQVRVLRGELKCASSLLGRPMLSADIDTLRRNWTLLIGGDA